MAERDARLRAYVEYFRDLGVHDFYRRGEPVEGFITVEPAVDRQGAPPAPVSRPAAAARPAVSRVPPAASAPVRPASAPAPEGPAPTPGYSFLDPPEMPLLSFDQRGPIAGPVAVADKAAALKVIQDEIGDCTRCPLAYAGRHKVVFADGDPNAKLMFVGEGPGADEDVQGLPFVGKAGQLLNNMISAMGTTREQVYIANIVKCRPPNNRVPEPAEANTCVPFLVRQLDIVKPQVVVALGATAATYLLGVKRSLSSMRGQWHSVRGAKVAVTYHPAFLLRDPRMKGEAWKDLQMVMTELGLQSPKKA